MDINVSTIKNYEGKSLPIDFEMMLEKNLGDDFEAVTPVRVVGDISNFGGTLEMNASGTVRLRMVCDRCAEEYETDVSFDIIEAFRELESLDNQNENPDIVYFSGDKLNLDEYVYSDLVLSLPGKHLCKDDCLGLCPMCGTNLNNGKCSCDTDVTDPRFDILDSLKPDD